MNTKLLPEAKPIISPLVNFTVNDDGITVETPNYSYDFSGQSADLMKLVIPHLDGTATIDMIAAVKSLRTNDIINHFSPLVEENLILDTNRSFEAKNNSDFIKDYFSECRFRSQSIFQQPFWQTLMNGTAPRDLVLGWGIEFYHYVEAANEHMAAATANCRDGLETQLWLAEHYVEEFDHSKIFLNGLENCGLNPEQVRQSAPLASTRALINFLTELASSDTLAYTATFGVMQFAQEETTESGIEKFCGYLSEAYPFGRGFFDAVRKHALIDVDLNHQELVIDKILANSDELDIKAKKKIIRVVQNTVEHFILFFEGITDFYQRENILIPRQKLDFRAVN